MTQLRYLFVAATVWFFCLYNIERLEKPINIASFVYVFVAICAVLVLSVPRLNKMPFYWLFGLALLPFLGLKYQLGYEILGQLAITVTEICAIGVTIFLASQIGQRLEELRLVVTNLTVGQTGTATQPFEVGQGHIYREIRRARRHQRPLTLLSIAIADDVTGLPTERFNQDVPLQRFIKDIQNDLVAKYMQARVADLLIAQFEDSAVITQRDEHFVTLLPETNREDVTEIVDKLQATVAEKLGLQIKVGVSTFPDEAVTFETLLERAEGKMSGSNVTHTPVTNSFRNIVNERTNNQVKFTADTVKNVLQT
jgi:GGDEF domain-containing protein